MVGTTTTTEILDTDQQVSPIIVETQGSQDRLDGVAVSEVENAHIPGVVLLHQSVQCGENVLQSRHSTTVSTGTAIQTRTSHTSNRG